MPNDNTAAPSVRRLGFTKLDKILFPLLRKHALHFTTLTAVAKYFGWQHCTGNDAIFYDNLVDAIDIILQPPLYENYFIHAGRTAVTVDKCFQYVRDVRYYKLAQKFVTGKFYQALSTQKKFHRSIQAIKSEYEDDGTDENGIAIAYLYNGLSFDALEELLGPYTILDAEEKGGTSALSAQEGARYRLMEEYIQIVMAEIKKSKRQQKSRQEAEFLQAYLAYWEAAYQQLQWNQKCAAIAMKNWLKTLPSSDVESNFQAEKTQGNVLFDIITKLERRGVKIDPADKLAASYSPQGITAGKSTKEIHIAQNMVETKSSIITRQKWTDYQSQNTAFEGEAIACHLKEFEHQEKVLSRQNQRLLFSQQYHMPHSLQDCQVLKKINFLKMKLEEESASIQSNAFYTQCWKNTILWLLRIQRNIAGEFFDERMAMIDADITLLKHAKKKLAKDISQNIDRKIQGDIDKKIVSKKNIMEFKNFFREESNSDEFKTFEENISVIRQITLFMQKNNLIEVISDNVILNHVIYQCRQEVSSDSVIACFEEIVRYASMSDKVQEKAALQLLRLLQGECLPESAESFQGLEIKISALFMPRSAKLTRAFMVQFVEKIIYPLKRHDPRYRKLIQRYTPYLDNIVNATTGSVITIYKKFIEAILATYDNLTTITIPYLNEDILMCARLDSIKKVITDLIKAGERDFILTVLKKNLHHKTAVIYWLLITLNDHHLFEAFFWERWNIAFPQQMDLFTDKDIEEKDNSLFSSENGRKRLAPILQKHFDMVSIEDTHGAVVWNKTLSQYIRTWGLPALIASDYHLQCRHIIHQFLKRGILTVSDSTVLIENLEKLLPEDKMSIILTIATLLKNTKFIEKTSHIVDKLIKIEKQENIQNIIEIYIHRKIENFVNNDAKNFVIFIPEEQNIADVFFNHPDFAQQRDAFLRQYLSIKSQQKVHLWDENIINFLSQTCQDPILKWQFIKLVIDEKNTELIDKVYDSQYVPVDFFESLVSDTEDTMPSHNVLVDMRHRAPTQYMQWLWKKVKHAICFPQDKSDAFVQAQWEDESYIKSFLNQSDWQRLQAALTDIINASAEIQLNFFNNKIVFCFVEKVLKTVMNFSNCLEDKQQAQCLMEEMVGMTAFCNVLQEKVKEFNQYLDNQDLERAQEYVQDFQKTAHNSRGAEMAHAVKRAEFFQEALNKFFDIQNLKEFIDKVLVQAIEAANNPKADTAQLSDNRIILDKNRNLIDESKMRLLQNYLNPSRPAILNILLECRQNFSTHQKISEQVQDMMLDPAILQDNPCYIVDRLIVLMEENKQSQHLVARKLLVCQKFFNAAPLRNIILQEGIPVVFDWIYYFLVYYQFPDVHHQLAFQMAQTEFSAGQNRTMLTWALALTGCQISAKILLAISYFAEEVQKYLEYMYILQKEETVRAGLDEFRFGVCYILLTSRTKTFLHGLDAQRLFPNNIERIDGICAAEIDSVRRFMLFLCYPQNGAGILQNEVENIFHYFKDIDLKSCLPEPKTVVDPEDLDPMRYYDPLMVERKKLMIDALVNNDLTEFKQYCQDGLMEVQHRLFCVLRDKMIMQAPVSELIVIIDKIQYQKNTPLMREQLIKSFVGYCQQFPIVASSAHQDFARKFYELLGITLGIQEKLLTTQENNEWQKLMEGQLSEEISSSPIATWLGKMGLLKNNT